MKKTIMATCSNTGAKIVSRHCYPHVVERMTEIVTEEAQRLSGSTDVEIKVTDKVEI